MKISSPVLDSVQPVVERGFFLARPDKFIRPRFFSEQWEIIAAVSRMKILLFKSKTRGKLNKLTKGAVQKKVESQFFWTAPYTILLVR